MPVPWVNHPFSLILSHSLSSPPPHHPLQRCYKPEEVPEGKGKKKAGTAEEQLLRNLKKGASKWTPEDDQVHTHTDTAVEQNTHSKEERP